MAAATAIATTGDSTTACASTTAAAMARGGSALGAGAGAAAGGARDSLRYVKKGKAATCTVLPCCSHEGHNDEDDDTCTTSSVPLLYSCRHYGTDAAISELRVLVPTTGKRCR